jgi:hypothetical protein
VRSSPRRCSRDGFHLCPVGSRNERRRQVGSGCPGADGVSAPTLELRGGLGHLQLPQSEWKGDPQSSRRGPGPRPRYTSAQPDDGRCRPGHADRRGHRGIRAAPRYRRTDLSSWPSSPSRPACSRR